MTSEEKLVALIKDIEAIVPYVISTLPYDGNFRSNNIETSHPDWVAIHKGRGVSSRRQLDGLLKKAQEYKMPAASGPKQCSLGGMCNGGFFQGEPFRCTKCEELP